nr:photosystem I subunit IX [Persicaria perfoliata]
MYYSYVLQYRTKKKKEDFQCEI